MMTLDEEQGQAQAWFTQLRGRICAEFEAIEREAGSDAHFTYTHWHRNDNPQDGGGERGLMKGKVFEKVGVNISTTGGTFSPEFAKSIPGTEEGAEFFATGISLVAHMANPYVPAFHMNTRFLTTGKRWFGGTTDINPPIVNAQDVAQFHAALEAACAAHKGVADYAHFKQWAERYYYIPHRQCARGEGGIFYDNMEGDFAASFGFARELGEAFLATAPAIIRARMHTPFTEAERHALKVWRGRYVEFNLVYDRGTLFGLKTGGNSDAILMSLPPEVVWE
jgi:coproporphyrinogen III oxidase